MEGVPARPLAKTNMMTLGRVLASTMAVTVATAAALLAAGEDNARAAGTSCDGALVRVSPKRTSVDTLRTLKPPRAQARRNGAGARAASRVYKVEAYLAGMRASGTAIDVVLEQPGRPGHQMIASFSGDACRKSKQTAKLRVQIAKARAALLAACGAPAATGVTVALDGIATITGAAGQSGSRTGIQLRPILRFASRACARRAPVSVSSPGPAPPGPAGPLPPSPEPQPEPEPPPEPNPPCTDRLTVGAIEAEANRMPGRVICLETAYYYELGDAVIAIDQPDVRVQAAPGAHPIVCGRFIIRGAGSSVARDVRIDPTCDVYFNENSPFNLAGGRYPSVPVPPTWLADFDGTGTGPLVLTSNWEHGKAVFKAGKSDPVTATFRIADASECADDPVGCVRWQPSDPVHRVADESSPQPERIPIPAGVRCPGLPIVNGTHDRALVIVSADGKTAWELWHCTHAATPEEPWYTAGVAAKWNLDPDDPAARGAQGDGTTPASSNGARASGLPLLITTITPREAIEGIHHPLGLTVKSVSDAFFPPASHTDGCAGCSHLGYGMLFVLDRAFKLPVDATGGEVNVVEALKRYGAYVVDRGPQFELDGSPNEPTDPAASDALWEAASVSVARLGIKPSDLRYVPLPGSPPAEP
jgi:hypothetical protein